MKIEHLSPDTLFDSRPYAFTQVVASEGKRLIHCAGQTAWDRHQNLIGAGDLGAQTRCALENLRHALAAAGASPANVVRIRTYIPQYQPAMLEIVSPVFAGFFAPAPAPANTLIGVQALALPEFLIEIEATAVVD
ncbi:MAG: RidA family protein [Gammaproteobacteria bacterium]|nr:RidA family protein [Gammaproteobacteria bacterium]